MKLLVFGSLNIDHVYALDHICTPGETITSTSYNVNCGGKGLNQAVAASKSGLEVWMAGQIGSDGEFLRDELNKNNVNTSLLKVSDVSTGNAIIQVDKNGQNCIVLFPGANRNQDENYVESVLSNFEKEDMIVLQNEINKLGYIIDKAYERGMTIVLNPSPYDDKLNECDLKKVGIFFINEVEGEQITGEKDPGKILDKMKKDYPNSRVVLTLGSDGARYLGPEGEKEQPIFKVEAVDTTAAGDTFSGYFLAGLGAGLSVEECLKRAAAASAIAVTRKGATASVPEVKEVDGFLKNQGA